MAAVAACSPRSLPSPPPSSSPRRTLASPVPRAAQGSNHSPSPPPPPPLILPKALIEIEKSRVIACLRAQDSMLAMEAARAALRGGISVLEVVMSTPAILEVIKGLLQEYPSSTIGVGTVLNARDARKAVHAGAKFLMSPGTVMVLYATNAGARIVKVYPVSILGGEKYISALKKPFPHIPMVASQGITIDSIRRYIEGGATAVVLSDAIFEKEAMRQRDFDAICRLAKLATFEGCPPGK